MNYNELMRQHCYATLCTNTVNSNGTTWLCSDGSISNDGTDYRVLTEDEADAAFDEALDNILDDVVLPDLDEALQCYFDRDAWKRDAQYDGRGHHLNHYDGEEYEEVVNGTSYYIYRVN